MASYFQRKLILWSSFNIQNKRFCSSSKNKGTYANDAKYVNKDSPIYLLECELKKYLLKKLLRMHKTAWKIEQNWHNAWFLPRHETGLKHSICGTWKLCEFMASFHLEQIFKIWVLQESWRIWDLQEKLGQSHINRMVGHFDHITIYILKSTHNLFPNSLQCKQGYFRLRRRLFPESGYLTLHVHAITISQGSPPLLKFMIGIFFSHCFHLCLH